MTFDATVTGSQMSGTFDVDAQSLARMLTVLLQGIAASARAGRSNGQLEAAIETALVLVAAP